MPVDVTAELANIGALADQRAKIERYRALLASASAAHDGAGLKAFADHLLQETVPLVVSRPVLQGFGAALARELDAPGLHDTLVEVAQHAVEGLQRRIVSFENADAGVRKVLGGVLKASRDYAMAANALAGIRMDGAGFSVPEKAAHFVDIAELFLEDDQTIEADDYINRAAQFINGCDDAHVTMRFKVSYARILDSKRRFLDAAVRYYELSCIQDKDVREEDLTTLLEKAVVCAILAAAGPRRSRMLGTLHKDARSRSHLPLHQQRVLEQARTMYRLVRIAYALLMPRPQGRATRKCVGVRFADDRCNNVRVLVRFLFVCWWSRCTASACCARAR